MSDINMLAPIVQMPNLQGMAAAQLAHPEVQQVFAQQMAQELQKEQNQQVQKVDKQEQAVSVKDDETHNSPQGQHQQQRRQSRQEQDEPVASGSPWIGHLLNKKV
jgi:hypothetical protein